MLPPCVHLLYNVGIEGDLFKSCMIPSREHVAGSRLIEIIKSVLYIPIFINKSHLWKSLDLDLSTFCLAAKKTEKQSGT